MRRIVIFLFLFIHFGFCQSSLAQDTRIHLYCGASINIQTTIVATFGIGIGIETGLKNDIGYLGLEYGSYALINIGVPAPIIRLESIQGLPVYYGFHCGFIIEDKYWIGVVGLWGSVTVKHSQYPYQYPYMDSTYRQTWFNVGPDLRLRLSKKVTFDVAYTIQRGLKFGVAYIF